MIRGREILCWHDSESDGLDGFDEMGHASSKKASFAGVHEHLATDQIGDCINDHRHEQLVRANGAHTIVRPVGGLALRRSLTRDRSPRRAVLHHLDHVGKVIDRRPLVLPSSPPSRAVPRTLPGGTAASTNVGAAPSFAGAAAIRIAGTHCARVGPWILV